MEVERGCVAHSVPSMEDDGSAEGVEDANVLSKDIQEAFEAHIHHLQLKKRQRVSQLQLRSHLEADQEIVDEKHDAENSERAINDASFGVWQHGDVWQGDVCLRTLRDLLLKIDREGCAPHAARHIAIRFAVEDWSRCVVTPPLPCRRA